MKKISLLLALIMLLSSLVSCGKSSDIPEGMQLASGDDVAYILYVPSTWNLNSSDGSNGAYYSQNDKSNVSVTSYYPDMDTLSVPEYFAKSEASYKNVYESYTLISGEKEIVFGNKKGLKYEFKGDIDGVSYQFMQIISIHDNRFYILTYTSTADNYELHLDDVDRITENFVFR